MSLDLGALVGSVILETTTFDRAYSRVVQQFSQLGLDADKASGGVISLDQGLTTVATSAAAAAEGLEKVVATTSTSTASEDKAAAAAERHAAALARVSEVTGADTDASTRLQAAQLRQIAAQDRLDTATASGTASTARLAGAQASLIAATDRVGAAQAEAAVETSAFRDAMGTALKTAGELGLALGAFELIKQGIDITKEATAYQKSMTLIQTLTGASKDEVDAMSKSLLGLAGQVAQSPDDLAVSLYHMESIGLHGAQALDAVRIAAEGAKIGNADLEETTNALTSTIASGITKNQSFSDTMSELLTIVGTGDMKLSDFNESLSSGLLAILSKTGVSLTDVGAAIATFGDNNIRGANAATMLRVAVQALQTPAKQGEDALAGIGLQTDTLRKVMQQGGLNAALTVLRQHLIDNGVAANQTGAVLVDAFGKKANSGISVLLANYDRLQSKYAMLEGGAQTFAQRWDTTQKTASFALDRIGASVQAAGISIASKLLPEVTAAAVWLGTTLPHDLSLLGQSLTGVGRMTETVFGEAWKAAGVVLHLAGDALGVVVSALHDMQGPLTVVGTIALTTWAAFKGAQIVQALIEAAVLKIKALPGAVSSMAASVRTSTASYVSSMAALGTASEDAAVTTTASMGAIEDEAAVMSGAIVTEGEVASVGWAGLLGPLAGVAIGVGLLMSLFHKSAGASKEASDAAKAYSDALSGAGAGSSTSIFDSIVTQLKNNNVPATIDQLNKSLNSTQFSAATFETAIQKQGAPLAALRTSLQAVIDANDAGQQKLAATQGANGNAIDAMRQKSIAASKLLSDLNIQAGVLSAQTQKDLTDTKAFSGVSASIDQVTTAIDQQGQATIVTSDNATTYAGILGIAVDKNGVAAVSAATLTKAITTVSGAFNNATETGSTYLDALKTFSGSAGTAADRAAIIGATLVAANGDALNFASAMAGVVDANRQLISSFDQAATTAFPKSKDALQKYAAQIINVKDGTINYAQAGAVPLIQSLQAVQTAAEAAAEAQYQHELQTKGGTKAADDAYKTYVGQTQGQLIAEAKQLGLTATQAQTFADQYDGIADAPDVKKTIEMAGADPVVTVLNQIGTQLAVLTGKPWVSTLTANPTPAQTKIRNLQYDIDQIRQNKAPGLNADSQAAQHKIADLQTQIDKLRGITIPVGINAADFWAGWAPISAALQRASGATSAGSYQAQVKGNQAAGHSASGQSDWRGGMTSLAEAGFEIVTDPTVQNLPKHAQVLNHGQAEDFMKSLANNQKQIVEQMPSLDGARLIVDMGSLGSFVAYIDGRADGRIEANNEALAR